MKESCALDVADRVAETGEEMPGSLVGHLLGGLSKQGIEQLINGEDTSHGYRRTGALDRMRKSLTVLLNGADPSFEHPESRPVDSTPKGGKR